jgi:hypothetical protein
MIGTFRGTVRGPCQKNVDPGVNFKAENVTFFNRIFQRIEPRISDKLRFDDELTVVKGIAPPANLKENMIEMMNFGK